MQAIDRVGEVLDADGDHHQIAKSHQHPADESVPEQFVGFREAQCAERMAAHIALQWSGGEVFQEPPRRQERAAENHKQPAVMPESLLRIGPGAGQHITGDQTEQPGPDHSEPDRARKVVAPFVCRVVVTVNLREQRDRPGGAGHRHDTADKKQRQRLDGGHQEKQRRPNQ